MEAFDTTVILALISLIKFYPTLDYYFLGFLHPQSVNANGKIATF